VGQKVRRVLFDANVWRHIADADCAHKVDAVCRRRGLEVLVAPSVVYEALRTGDARLRARLAEAMTRSGWRRLMPEAFDECEEFLSETQRLRSEWLRPPGPTVVRDANQNDWNSRERGAFWDRLRRAPDTVAGHVGVLEGDTIQTARADARQHRRRFLEGGIHFESIDLNRMSLPLQSDDPQWNGVSVESWRLTALAWATESLVEPPYLDWIGEMVRLPDHLFNSRSWATFWLRDVASYRLPRWWLRGACEVLQSSRKISDGTPCDAQLATHLVACHYFMTYDWAFSEILEKCRAAAPMRMGRTIWIPTDSDPAANLLAHLDQVRRG
jgi:hypothetical protein